MTFSQLLIDDSRESGTMENYHTKARRYEGTTPFFFVPSCLRVKKYFETQNGFEGPR